MSDQNEDRESRIEDGEELEGAYWSGFDAMLCWIGAGVFALLMLFGLGHCRKLELEGEGNAEVIKRSAQASATPSSALNPPSSLANP